MGFGDDVQRDIVRNVKSEYQEAAFWLPFGALEIKDVFNESELSDLSDFITDMKKVTEENERAAKVQEKAVKYSKVAVKLLKMAKVIP